MVRMTGAQMTWIPSSAKESTRSSGTPAASCSPLRHASAVSGHPPHPRAARAVRGPHGRWLRPRQRTHGHLPRHERARRDEPRHRHLTSWMDSTPVFALTGNVSATLGRTASRKPHHGITHRSQSTTPRHAARRDRPHVREAAHIFALAAPARCSSNPQGRVPGVGEYMARAGEPAWYKPTVEGTPADSPRGRADRPAERPISIAGHGISGATPTASSSTGGESRHPCDHDVPGLGGMPESHPLSYGWLACTACSTRTWPPTKDDSSSASAALRRPRDGALQGLQPRRQDLHSISTGEIGKNFPTTVPIVGSAKNVLPRLAEQSRS